MGGGKTSLTVSLAATIVLVSALGPMGTQLVLPALPDAGQALGASPETIRLAFPLFILGLAVGQPIYGPVSDVIGRRRTLLAGLSFFVVGGVFTVFAASIEVFLVGRLMEGLGACAGVVLGRAIISDIAERDRAGGILADLKVAMILVPMVAPFVGGLIASAMGWQAVMAALGSVGLLALVIAFFLLPETAKLTETKRFRLVGIATDYFALLRDRQFVVPAGVVAFSTASFFAFLGGGAFVVRERYGYSPTEFGAALAVVNGGFLIGNLIAGRLNRIVGGLRMMLLGTSVALGGALLVAIVSTVNIGGAFAVIGLTAVMAFGHGFCVQNGFAFAMDAQPERNGAASGLAGFSQMALGAACAGYASAVAVSNLNAPSYLMLAATAVALLLALVLFHQIRRSTV